MYLIMTKKIGEEVSGKEILDISSLSNVVKENNIKVAILAITQMLLKK